MTEFKFETIGTVEQYTWKFSDLIIVCRKPKSREYTIWYVVCQNCGTYIRVKRYGSKIWVAKCQKCKAEYTITPADYYVRKPVNFSRIIGVE
jgi:hypothetical protein